MTEFSCPIPANRRIQVLLLGICRRMGCCFSRSHQTDYEGFYVSGGGAREPSLEERRRLQAEAAQKRLDQQASYGLANPQSVQHRQEKARQMEAEQGMMSSIKEGPALRWTTG
ncbi:hypothetical protein AAHC03_0528 [Spirometra sp. Aus1]